MKKEKIYNKNKTNLEKCLVGQKIVKIDYLENIPLEDDCIKIFFADDSYFLIYSIMRLIDNNQIILCSADYYFNKNFIEDYNIDTFENTLIFDSLKNANKLLKDKFINNLTFNDFGDLVLNIGVDSRIEILIDTSENDKDFYVYYSANGNYFSLFVKDNRLLIAGDIK